jgi:hypothetical protein
MRALLDGTFPLFFFFFFFFFFFSIAISKMTFKNDSGMN